MNARIDMGADTYATVIETARESRTQVVGHVPRSVGIRAVMAAGQHSIEHLDVYLEGAEADNSPFHRGGDGTLTEVLNGVGRLDHGLAQVTFGVIPLGTGNDFATALGLPADISDAIEALLGGEAAAVDIGRMNDQYFVNVSAGGFIAEVSDAVNPQLKNVAGKLSYLIGGAQVVLTYEPVRARLLGVGSTATPPTADAQNQAPLPSTMALHAFAVCNSRLVGGGRLIAPHATVITVGSTCV